MLGKLTWDAIPFTSDPHGGLAHGVLVILGISATPSPRLVAYLWREWITSVDHKRIGVMYSVLALVMLLRGFTDAIMMRSQLASPPAQPGLLPPEHYDQIFSHTARS